MSLWVEKAKAVPKVGQKAVPKVDPKVDPKKDQKVDPKIDAFARRFYELHGLEICQISDRAEATKHYHKVCPGSDVPPFGQVLYALSKTLVVRVVGGNTLKWWDASLFNDEYC